MEIRNLQAAQDGIIVAETTENGGVHRRVIYFGADMSAEPDAVKAFAASIGFAAKAPPAPPAPTLADYSAAIQTIIEATAQARGYDSSISLISYATSSNPQWAAEAKAFAAWRDQIWTYVYTQLAAVQSGQRAQPSAYALVAEIPAISWPE